MKVLDEIAGLLDAWNHVAATEPPLAPVDVIHCEQRYVQALVAAWPLIERALRAAQAYREAELEADRLTHEAEEPTASDPDWFNAQMRAVQFGDALDAALAALGAQPG